MNIRANGQTIVVDSLTYSARFQGAALASVICKRTGCEFIRASENLVPPELTYVNGDPLVHDKHEAVAVRQLSELAARVVITGNDSDRELFVWLDTDTGDLCVRPSGQSARRGVLSVRWNVLFVREAALVLPCVNGIFVEPDRSFPGNDRFVWPHRWDAQLAIAERGGDSLMIHSEDSACKFKALNLRRDDGLSALGFESEQLGPVRDNRAAGGIAWRLNVYNGNWQTPAGRYREWLRRTYSLDQKRKARPAWVDDIRLCVCWAHAKPESLDALARIYDPKKTLIHLSNWRTSKYDVDYPDYFPSDEAGAYMRKANAMGFRVMPHFNYWACDCGHPVLQRVRDWQIRDVISNAPQGWNWPPETHDYTRMAYIHTGLALWRRTLIDAVRGACAAVSAPAAFLDQTLCTWNTDNGLVENMTTVEGLRQLQEEFVAINPAMVLAGECLNEISFQRQCFAQAHIHDGWGDLRPEHVLAAHPICSFLWQGHTRLVGYHHLATRDKDADIGIEVYRRMGAMPTIAGQHAISPGDNPEPSLDQPNVRRVVELAGGLGARFG